MALAGSDLLVVQQQTGDKDIKSLSIDDLSTFLNTSPNITFKGVANMTVSGDEPPAEDRVAGNLYLNNATTSGTFAWTGGTAPFSGTVQPNAQAVWVEPTGWAVTNNTVGDVGVEEVQAAEPIHITGSTEEPVVNIRDGSDTVKGAVQLATDQDVIDGTANLVVTAAQLKTTNEAISNAGGGTVTNVTGTAPIVVANNSTTPAISVTAADQSAAGVSVLADSTVKEATSNTKAATPKYVDAFYLIKDFSSLPAV